MVFDPDTGSLNPTLKVLKMLNFDVVMTFLRSFENFEKIQVFE